MGLEVSVAVLQVQDLGDPGDVDARIDEFDDPLESSHVIVAVAAGAALGTRRGEQSTPLIQPQALRIDTG